MIILGLSVKLDNEYVADMIWIISIWSSFQFFLIRDKYLMMILYAFISFFFLEIFKSYHDSSKINHDFFLKSEQFRQLKLTCVRKWKYKRNLWKEINDRRIHL